MQTFKTSKSRENILSKIRKELGQEQTAMPFPEAEKDNSPLYAFDGSSTEEMFASSFIQLGGKFVFCDNEQELLENIHQLYESRGWHQLLCAEKHLLTIFNNNKLSILQPAEAQAEGADACITGCEVAVARTGSIMLSSRQHMGRTSSVFFPVHIVVIYAGQIVNDISDGFIFLKNKYGAELPTMINLNTGPSRTADIEKTLVVGVHGPGEVFCFFVNA